MPKHDLNIKTIADLDNGLIAAAFDHHIQIVADDCADRPVETRARKLVMQLEFVPTPRQDGNLDMMQVVCQVTSRIPPHSTRAFEMEYRKGGATFNRDAPEDFRQMTLSDCEEEDQDTDNETKEGGDDQ